jgi:hypothetical protein
VIRPTKKSESSFLKAGAAVDLVTIAVLWCIAVAIVHPVGNFPLNDDWSYGRTVKHLLEQREFRPSGPMVMPLLSQAVWGALFCIPDGFSFNALRFSTLTLSLIGLAGLYVLIRQLHSSRSLAILCVLLLAFNPIYFALSNTFMADVPFTAMVTLAALFFVRYFQTESVSMLAVAIVLAIVATLCRQLAIALPMAFAATLLLKHGIQKRNIAIALLPSILVIGCLVAFNLWLKAAGRVPEDYDLKTGQLRLVLSHPVTIPLYLVHRGWNATIYLGCFLLPLLILVMSNRRRARVVTLTKVALVVFVAFTVARFIFMPSLMPVHNNILDPHGIGPLTLRDTQLLHLPHVVPLSKFFWAVVTVLSLFGAWVLIFESSAVVSGFFFANPPTGDPKSKTQGKVLAWCHRAVSNWRIPEGQPEAVDRTIATFFLVCSVVYLGPLAIGGFFDRYLLPVVVFLAAFFAAMTKTSEAPPRRWPCAVALLLTACFAWFAIASTRDYFSWNRTRWTALADLHQANVPPEKIDGGFEFNGLETYVRNYVRMAGKSDWWVQDDEYVLSFGAIKGFEKFREYEYVRWLPPSRGKLFVLKRKSSGQPQHE